MWEMREIGSKWDEKGETAQRESQMSNKSE